MMARAAGSNIGVGSVPVGPVRDPAIVRTGSTVADASIDTCMSRKPPCVGIGSFEPVVKHGRPRPPASPVRGDHAANVIWGEGAEAVPMRTAVVHDRVTIVGGQVGTCAGTTRAS